MAVISVVKLILAVVRVRLKIIGNLETMHDLDLPRILIISLPIIFKRTVCSIGYIMCVCDIYGVVY